MNNTWLWIGAGIAVLLLLPTGAKASGAVYDRLESLRGTYSDRAIDDLSALAAELQTRGLSDNQVLFLLSQALQETGIFTDSSANWYAVETRKNYAGITRSGAYEVYNSISDFVDDWLGVLDKGAYPLDASSISDFNKRLKSNGYYTDNINIYGNNLSYYYNLLNQ